MQTVNVKTEETSLTEDTSGDEQYVHERSPKVSPSPKLVNRSHRKSSSSSETKRVGGSSTRKSSSSSDNRAGNSASVEDKQSEEGGIASSDHHVSRSSSRSIDSYHHQQQPSSLRSIETATSSILQSDRALRPPKRLDSFEPPSNSASRNLGQNLSQSEHRNSSGPVRIRVRRSDKDNPQPPKKRNSTKDRHGRRRGRPGPVTDGGGHDGGVERKVRSSSVDAQQQFSRPSRSRDQPKDEGGERRRRSSSLDAEKTARHSSPQESKDSGSNIHKAADVVAPRSPRRRSRSPKRRSNSVDAERTASRRHNSPQTTHDVGSNSNKSSDVEQRMMHRRRSRSPRRRSRSPRRRSNSVDAEMTASKRHSRPQSTKDFGSKGHKLVADGEPQSPTRRRSNSVDAERTARRAYSPQKTKDFGSKAHKPTDVGLRSPRRSLSPSRSAAKDQQEEGKHKRRSNPHKSKSVGSKNEQRSHRRSVSPKQDQPEETHKRRSNIQKVKSLASKDEGRLRRSIEQDEDGEAKIHRTKSDCGERLAAQNATAVARENGPVKLRRSLSSDPAMSPRRDLDGSEKKRRSGSVDGERLSRNGGSSHGPDQHHSKERKRRSRRPEHVPPPSATPNSPEKRRGRRRATPATPTKHKVKRHVEGDPSHSQEYNNSPQRATKSQLGKETSTTTEPPPLADSSHSQESDKSELGKEHPMSQQMPTMDDSPLRSPLFLKSQLGYENSLMKSPETSQIGSNEISISHLIRSPGTLLGFDSPSGKESISELIQSPGRSKLASSHLKENKNPPPSRDGLGKETSISQLVKSQDSPNNFDAFEDSAPHPLPPEKSLDAKAQSVVVASTADKCTGAVGFIQQGGQILPAGSKSRNTSGGGRFRKNERALLSPGPRKIASILGRKNFKTLEESTSNFDTRSPGSRSPNGTYSGWDTESNIMSYTKRGANPEEEEDEAALSGAPPRSPDAKGSLLGRSKKKEKAKVDMETPYSPPKVSKSKDVRETPYSPPKASNLSVEKPMNPPEQEYTYPSGDDSDYDDDEGKNEKGSFLRRSRRKKSKNSAKDIVETPYEPPINTAANDSPECFEASFDASFEPSFVASFDADFPTESEGVATADPVDAQDAEPTAYPKQDVHQTKNESTQLEYPSDDESDYDHESKNERGSFLRRSRKKKSKDISEGIIETPYEPPPAVFGTKASSDEPEPFDSRFTANFDVSAKEATVQQSHPPGEDGADTKPSTHRSRRSRKKLSSNKGNGPRDNPDELPPSTNSMPESADHPVNAHMLGSSASETTNATKIGNAISNTSELSSAKLHPKSDFDAGNSEPKALLASDGNSNMTKGDDAKKKNSLRSRLGMGNKFAELDDQSVFSIPIGQMENKDGHANNSVVQPTSAVPKTSAEHDKGDPESIKGECIGAEANSSKGDELLLQQLSDVDESDEESEEELILEDEEEKDIDVVKNDEEQQYLQLAFAHPDKCSPNGV